MLEEFVDTNSINLTEIDIDEPTHYTRGTGKLSHIDRAAFSAPS